MALRQLLLVRHGETNGASSVRYFGSTDVELSPAGREQMVQVGNRLAARRVDLWLASNLRRSWVAAGLVSRGAPVRLDPDLREVHFGQWEGLTREEIEARDPILYQDWQAGAEAFEYPGGEARSVFRARVGRALERILASPGMNAVAVLHKGVIREIARQLTGATLDREQPPLGGIVALTRVAGGPWIVGERSSNPEGLAASL